MASRRSSVTGFKRIPVNPRALYVFCVSTSAVTAYTGRFFHCSFPRISRISPSPSKTGIHISVRTISMAGSFLSISNASAPFSARMVSFISRRRNIALITREFTGTSSTIRMRGFFGGCAGFCEGSTLTGSAGNSATGGGSTEKRISGKTTETGADLLRDLLTLK